MPLFNLFILEGMDSDNFQCINGGRGLNTIGLNKQFLYWG